MPQYLLLVMALKVDRIVAGALFFIGADTLYGRYWGCTEEYRFLHFETCYYQGIDYCIRHKIARIDSGAQGEHKIQRGFTPVHTWSSHWIQHPAFADAIENFLQDEQQHINAYVMRATDYLPFRKDLEFGEK
jgi:predicted N-acyltransferase